jgi:hypothetical protein
MVFRFPGGITGQSVSGCDYLLGIMMADFPLFLTLVEKRAH